MTLSVLPVKAKLSLISDQTVPFSFKEQNSFVWFVNIEQLIQMSLYIFRSCSLWVLQQFKWMY